MEILRVENLSKVYGKGETEVKALDNVSFSIEKGQFVAIIGPSGSGKSTLAFDTIYNEGERRYMESLSSYARQFLGNADKPDVA